MVQSWWQYGVRFGDPKFDFIYHMYYIYACLPSITQPVLLSLTLQIIRGHLVLLLIGKAVVLPFGLLGKTNTFLP